MDAVVIPWFLALTSFAAINNTQIRTDYGPVYVYNVDVDFSRSPERNTPANFVLNFTSTLKCQARNASVLFCTLGEGKMDSISFKQNHHLRTIQTGKESFEIDYSEAGVESLRVYASTASDKRFGLVKMVVSQLNVGTDFKKHRSFTFTTNETSSLGECETVFNALITTCAKDPTREGFRMRSIFHDSLGDSVLIRKRRNTRNCDRPNKISLIENSESVVLTVTSSYSEMHVCSDSFESSTIVEGKGRGNGDSQAFVFQQSVKVRLENVERTEEDLPTFATDSAINAVYLHKDVDNNDLDT